MSDIQEQVEKLLDEVFATSATTRVRVGGSLNILLRAVVEECCRTTQIELEFWFRGTDMETPKDILKAIQGHFDWLLK